MAKVKSVTSSSSFYINKPSFPELKFGLGLTEDCSAKCDFDISSLLSDNEILLERQYADNDNWHGEKADKKNGECSLTSMKIENPKFTTLDALAENHLKKNKMIPELNFDGDFSLSDLLSNDDCPRDKNSKSNSLCENDNLLELCLLTDDDNPRIGKTSGTKNDISFDDLSVWMNSSTSPPINSLECFPSHFSCDVAKGKHKKKPVSPQINVKDTGSDILVSDFLENTEKNHKSSVTISNVDLLNILGEITFHGSDTTDSIDTTDSKKHESANEISDDSDILPDIDLTFCIKKNSKNDFSFYGHSPETVDSGFDESDFISDKLSIPFDGKSSYKDILISQSNICTKNTKVKQSLFSKAISAKPKINDSKKSKLKSVMNELLKGSMPLIQNAQNINLEESQRTIDHSNELVIVSRYIYLTDEK